MSTIRSLAVARIVRDRRSSLNRFVQLFALAAIILAVFSLEYEIINGPARYLDEVRATAWVTMPGNDNLISDSYFTADTLAALKASPGVTSADGVFLNYTQITSKAGTVSGIALAYAPRGITAPRLSMGTQASQPGETVIDGVLPGRLGVTVGDYIHVGALRLKVVGVAPRVNSIAKDIAFITAPDMARLTGASVFGAAAVAGNLADIRAAATRLGLVTFTQKQWVASNVQYWNTAVGPLFGLILVSVIVFGTLLVASSLRREVDSSRRTTAILLALGQPKAALVRSEISQMLAVGIIGFALAVPAAMGILVVASLAVARVCSSRGR